MKNIKINLLILVTLLCLFMPSFAARAQTTPPSTSTSGSGFSLGGLAQNFLPAPLSVGVSAFQAGQNISDLYNLLSNPSLLIENYAATISNFFLKVSSFFLWVAAQVFNFTIQYSLNLGDFLKNLPIVNIGWTVLRDIANLCFIFILLAIAIGTILQVDSYDAKKLLARVIIVAILLNFSLFFAKVIIDASNILTLEFYNKIISNSNTSSITDVFMQGLGLSSLYNTQGFIQSNSNIALVGIGGSILLLCTAFVFFAAAILFLIRSLVLVILMIVSPVAFLANILPQTKQYWSKWLDALLKQSFFAPIFMIFIYIVATMLNTQLQSGGAKDIAGNPMNFASFLVNNPGNGSLIGGLGGTVYTFILLIGLMLASLLVAQKFGAYGGNVARNLAGKASFGVAGWTGRQFIGRTALSVQNSRWIKEKAKNSKTGFFRAVEGGLGRTAGASFDARSVGGFGKVAGGLGDAGGKGGFGKSVEDRQKRLEAQKKRIESKTQSEESELYNAEQDRDVTEKIRADKLLDERDGFEARRVTTEAQRDQAQADLQAAQAELARVEPDLRRDIAEADRQIETLNRQKADAEREFNDRRMDIRDQIKRQEALVDNPSTSQTDKEVASLKVNGLLQILNQEANDHTAEKNRLDADADTQRRAKATAETSLNTANATVQSANTSLGTFNTQLKAIIDDIKETDKRLHKINEDYDEKGIGNGIVSAEMRSKAIEAKATNYAQIKNLDAMNSKDLAAHTREIHMDRIKPVNDAAKGRGKEYAKPGKIDNFAGALGITTAQMAMAVKIRNDDRKGADKKLLADLKKFAQEGGLGGGAPSAPTAPTTPPAGGGGTTTP